jgi:DNA repair photolyase
MQYRPDKILVEENALEYPFCKKILQQLNHIPMELIGENDASTRQSETPLSLSQGKKILYLKEFKASAFKLCPGFSEEVLCCNYFVLDLIENCPLECSYCILQAFLNKPYITFHVNIEAIISNMLETIKAYPDRPLRIGTGEHSDSLALDHIFQVNPYLVEVFSGLTNATLELKTKTNFIQPLIGLKHNGRTVVSWSLNPVELIQSNEYKTATLEERLTAASTLADEGYKVGFHFDPLIHHPGWKSGYKRTIERLFETIKPEDIAWISIGTLRYIPKLKQIAEERFPKTAIFANEFISAGDGKMRYIKPIRREMMTSVSQWIHEKAPGLPLYLCMEPSTSWSKLRMPCLNTPLDLEAYLGRNTP